MGLTLNKCVIPYQSTHRTLSNYPFKEKQGSSIKKLSLKARKQKTGKKPSQNAGKYFWILLANKLVSDIAKRIFFLN